MPQKSIVIYANKRFGTKRFDCTGVWPEKPNITEVKSFELKNSGADFNRAHMRDPLVNLLIGRNNPNVDWQAFNAAITYINGEFKGIYEFRERTNEDFIEANYNGLEDIDMIENWSDVKAGSIDGLMDFYNLLNSKDVTFEEVSKWLDLDNTLPIYATNIFGSNIDSGGGNNTIMWRTLEENARWRHVVKDVDLWGGMWNNSNVDYDMFASFIFQDNYTQFEHKFRYKILSIFLFTDSVASSHLIDHIVAATGDFLQPEYFNSVADEIHDFYAEDYARYLKLYSDASERSIISTWEKSIADLKNFVVARRPALFSQISNRYKLGKHFNLFIEHPDDSISLNGIKLYRPQFDGLYFSDRPLILSHNDSVNWEVITTDTLGVTTSETYYGKEIELCATPSTSSMNIHLICGY